VRVWVEVFDGAARQAPAINPKIQMVIRCMVFMVTSSGARRINSLLQKHKACLRRLFPAHEGGLGAPVDYTGVGEILISREISVLSSSSFFQWFIYLNLTLGRHFELD
jgi:hypothetical protein